MWMDKYKHLLTYWKWKMLCCYTVSVGSCALLSLQNHKTLSKNNMNHLRPWHLYISYPYNTASFEYIAAITITSSPLPHYKAKRHLWALYDIAITIATLHGSVTMFILITSPPSLWTAFLHCSHAFQIRREWIEWQKKIDIFCMYAKNRRF